MATQYQNLSAYNTDTVPLCPDMRVAIVVAEWNSHITFALCDGAVNTLIKQGINESNISVHHVPGTYELIYASQQLCKQPVDAVIAIGCVVRGDTPHFDYICQGVTNGLAQLNVQQNVPVIFGVLTTDTMQQAQDRAGGVHGNKGDEAAITAIKMYDLHNSL